ncbi:TolC family protein [Calditerrivibrio nitroreducens]|uniref:Outer membrane efflux protein n=1 Tax=Calditerrivibrio nitroreducens (strain DSM 19672 / NBRC 101217 / Yu37-1) TaxID=768670 RepID=E4TFV0_CALNY|nr:TolC family protein [Calditerrivibrio nitroreducens]ADR19606.1 outer membrane efflux protein [Calditerrivibrio nitroreducens DSM 19672]
MLNKKALVSIFIFSSLSLNAAQLTLEEAKNILLEKNGLIKAYSEEVTSSQFRVEQAKSGFMPKLNISETFISTDEPGSAAFIKISQGNFTPTYMATMSDPDRTKNFETKIELVQPLLLQGKVYFGFKQAEEMKKASEKILDAVKQELIYNLVRAYYGKALADKSVEVTEKSMERTKKYRDLTAEFYRNGLLVKSDLLVAESRVNLNESYIAEAKKQVEVAHSHLQRLLDKDGVFSVMWSDPGLKVDKSLDEYIKIAIENRKDLKAMEDFARVQELEYKKNRWSYSPEIVAFANYKMNDTSFLGDSGKGFTVGAMINFNIFNGFMNKNKISEEKSKKMAIDYKLLDKRNEIKSEVKDAYYSVLAAESKIEAMKKSLEASYAALNITENRFKEGLARITDLLDREVDVKNAELALYMAEYELIESKTKLYKAAGILK